jgi:predicted RecB family nuclease
VIAIRRFRRSRWAETRIQDAHVSLLPNIRRRQRLDLIEAGVRRWTDLAGPKERFAEVERRWSGMKHVLAKLRTQAISMKRDASVRIGSLEPHLGTASQFNEQKVAGPGSSMFSGARIYLDLESDPLESRIYLFGYQHEEVRRTRRPDDLASVLEAHVSRRGALQNAVQVMDDRLDEAALFERLLDEIDSLREDYGRICVFHYGRFETSQLAALATRYPSIEGVTERVARLISECIDVHAVVVDTRCLPVPSYSLKDVAPCIGRLTDGRLGHRWEGPRNRTDLWSFLMERGMGRADAQRNLRAVERAGRRWRLSLDELLAPSAGTSVLWYRENLDEPAAVWQALIAAYNGDDLLATRAVVHWLLDEYQAENAPVRSELEPGAKERTGNYMDNRLPHAGDRLRGH